MQERQAPVREAIDAALERLLTEERRAPSSIRDAIVYAVLGEGKRLRPRLLIASGEAAGASREELLPAACAAEMIHAFSLIHDDLPALDDDDLRRGRPSVHVKFGEAIAVLAGDALLNLAFGTLAAHPPGGADGASRSLAVIRTFSDAVGLGGMISGQVLDLEYEGKPAGKDDLDRIHSLKTGALITACCRSGCIIAGAGEVTMHALAAFGEALGLAFQITDDILDVEGTAASIGKSPGKDARASKTTFPKIWGLEASRRLAREKVDEALASIEPLGARAASLAELARAVASRKR